MSESDATLAQAVGITAAHFAICPCPDDAECEHARAADDAMGALLARLSALRAAGEAMALRFEGVAISDGSLAALARWREVNPPAAPER